MAWFKRHQYGAAFAANLGLGFGYDFTINAFFAGMMLMCMIIDVIEEDV
jgi:hypothetical protein